MNRKPSFAEEQAQREALDKEKAKLADKEYEELKPKMKIGFGKGLLIAIGVLIGVNALLPEKDDTTTNGATSTKHAVVSNSAWDGSVSQIERYLDANLKDPDSFEAIEWSEVQEVNAPTHKYIVRCKYRAKNSYGGYVIENQVFHLDKQGKVVNVVPWAQ